MKIHWRQYTHQYEKDPKMAQDEFTEHDYTSVMHYSFQTKMQPELATS